MESFRSTFALAEERGGLCSFVFFGPAFKKFPDTIHRRDNCSKTDTNNNNNINTGRLII